MSVLPFAVVLIDEDGTIAASSNAYTELSSRVRALRAAGEKWVAPDGNQVTIREVSVDGGSQRLAFVTPR